MLFPHTVPDTFYIKRRSIEYYQILVSNRCIWQVI